MKRYAAMILLVLLSIFTFACSADNQPKTAVSENQDNATSTQYGNKIKILLGVQNDLLSAGNTKIFYEGTGFDRKDDGLKIFVNGNWNNVTDNDKGDHLSRIFRSWIDTAKSHEITVNSATFHIKVIDYKSNATLVVYDKEGIRPLK
ncbi:MAG TPA: hypothetical protein VN611_17440 [Patescibacteria group bacterium]|nr:hypothetical protein [Patescibacteria group bacterium]